MKTKAEKTQQDLQLEEALKRVPKGRKPIGKVTEVTPKPKKPRTKGPQLSSDKRGKPVQSKLGFKPAPEDKGLKATPQGTSNLLDRLNIAQSVGVDRRDIIQKLKQQEAEKQREEEARKQRQLEEALQPRQPTIKLPVTVKDEPMPPAK